MLVAVVLAGARGDLPVAEFARGLADELLFVGEFEVDHVFLILQDARGRVRQAVMELPPGHEIAPGRTTLKQLGGGNRYEVYLVWDEHRFSVMVAKVLRPDLVEEEYALRGLRREIEALRALSHPVLLRAFDAYIEGPHPHLVVEHLEGPDAAPAHQAERCSADGADAAARPARGLGHPLHGRGGLGPPRPEARQPRDGHPAAGDRPEPRAHHRARQAAERTSSARTRTCRRSSATRAATWARRRTYGASARRSTTPSPAGCRSGGRARATPRRRSRTAIPQLEDEPRPWRSPVPGAFGGRDPRLPREGPGAAPDRRRAGRDAAASGGRASIEARIRPPRPAAHRLIAPGRVASLLPGDATASHERGERHARR